MEGGWVGLHDGDCVGILEGTKVGTCVGLYDSEGARVGITVGL